VRACGGSTMQPDQLAPISAELEDGFLRELEQTVGQRNFEHWFRDRTTISVSNDLLTIGVGSPFLLNWMQKQFRDAVSTAAAGVLGNAARIEFVVDARISLETATRSGSKSDRTPSCDQEQSAHSGRKATSRGGKTPGTVAPRSGRRFADLADFVSGPCNELALTAARQICHAPGDRYNPLFLYGGVGLGKTHLLEGIYRAIRRSYPSLRVTCLSSEGFANYFTQALREKTLPGFRQRFRNVDVLLVDDVDFLNGKRVIQEEFLHTFKRLEGHQRQIVLAADRHPRLLTGMSDELTTRLLSGLVCRIESPELETRRNILERKVAGRSATGQTAPGKTASVTPEAIAFIAQRFRNNVRELEGALNCLETYHSLTGRRVGVTAARRVLANLERDCIHVVRLSDIEQVVCEFFGVEPAELKSNRRHRSISRPRMLAMYLARKHTQAAYNEIGRYFGGRNHSTVMSAEKKVRTWLDDRAEFHVAAEAWPLSELLESLEQQLRAS